MFRNLEHLTTDFLFGGRQMHVSTAVSTVLVAVLLALLPDTALAQGQTFAQILAQRDLIPCPASQIAPEFVNYKRWSLPNVGIKPVIPELFGRNQSVVYRYLFGLRSDSDPPEVQAVIVRGHARLVRLFALEGYTTLGTPLDQAPKEPPSEFFEDLAKVVSSPENIHYRIIPCGRPISYLSWAEPDQEVNGHLEPAVMAESGPWLLDWCQKDVKVPGTGECGVEVMDTDPIPIRFGPNTDQKLTLRIFLVCGNPDLFLERIEMPPILEVVRPPQPQPVAPPVAIAPPPPLPPPPPPPPTVTLLVPKVWQNQKGETLEKPPSAWKRVAFLGQTGGIAVKSTFNGTQVMFVGLTPGSRLMLWEDPKTLKDSTDQTRRLIIDIPASAVGTMTWAIPYVNQVDQRNWCQKHHVLCGVAIAAVPLGVGFAIKSPGARKVQTDYTKGGIGPDGRPTPTSPGGSPR